MTEKKEYLEFKTLLQKCIGTRSQTKFADESGLSQEHINRMLRNDIISRPSKATLNKILSASNDAVTYQELYKSCGYDDEDAKFSVRQLRHSMDLADRMRQASKDLEAGFQAIIAESNVYASIGDAARRFTEKYSVEPFVLYTSKTEIASDIASKKGEFYKQCKVKWMVVDKKDRSKGQSIENYFVLFYVRTTNNNLVLTDVAVDAHTLIECDAIPATFQDMMEQDGADLQSLDFFAVATEVERNPSVEEERLLKAIFGEPDLSQAKILGNTEYGRGFVYSETPRDFCSFVLNHKEAFCSSEEATELYEELESKVKKGTSITEEYINELFKNQYCEGARGTAAVVLSIISSEVADRKLPFRVEYGESEEYEDVFPPCIYVNDTAWSDECGYTIKEKKQAVDEVMLAYAKELHMPTYGDTIVYKHYNVQFTDNQVLIEYDD
jgi:transcriptional regulator with XRE-family HTH domain